MQQVKLPDGSIAQFPDDMPDEAIEAALRSETKSMPQHPVAGPSGNALEDAVRFAGTAGTNALGGMLGLPRAAAGGLDWLAGKPPENPGVMSTLQDPVGTALRTIQPRGGFSEALGSVQQPGGGALFPAPADAREMAFQTTGVTEYQPQTWAGRRGMDALTGVVTAGRSAAMPASALGAATGGQAAEMAGNAGLPGSVQTAAALLGAAPGVAAGTAINNPGRTMGRMLTNPVPPNRAELADAALQRGIPLRAGQISDSRLLRAGDSEMSSMLFGGNTRSNRNIQEGYNRAGAKLIGEDASRLPPDVIDRAYIRIGDKFDSLYPKLNISPQVANNDLLGKLTVIQSEAKAAISPEGAHPIVTQIENILDKAATNGGAIPGDIYHALTKRDAPLSRAGENLDPNVRYYARQVRNALDDAVEASLPAGSPALEEFRAARAQYRALKLVQDSLTPDGDISGPRLAANVKREMGDTYHRGRGGDLEEVARIGDSFLREPANSQTATRQAVRSLPGKIADATVAGAGLGGAGYGASLVPGLSGPALTAGALGLGITRGLGALSRSRGLAEHLANPQSTEAALRMASPSLISRLLMANSIPELQGTR